MRKSAAPSQISKRSLFSPPYKNNSNQISVKRVCKFASNEDKEDGLLRTGEISSINNYVILKSPAELVNLMKNIPIQEKENSLSVSHSLSSVISQNLSYSPSKNNPPERKDLSDLTNSDEKLTLNSETGSQINDNGEKYFSVVWCKLSKKKHKNWEGDAVIIVKGRSVILKDMEGKEIGRGSGYKLKDLETLDVGNTLPVGSKEIEIQDKIEPQHFFSGRCFHGSSSMNVESQSARTPRPKLKPFQQPVKNKTALQSGHGKDPKKPLYDASRHDSIILPRPPAQHQWAHNSSFLPIMDLVVDPYLGTRLRPHQRDGVLFLYERVMGFHVREFKGAILADEMGLGKTLQCITLIWTLLKQGPYGGNPILKRVLIVTPSSLIANWGKEFEKWLGRERIQPYLVDQRHKVDDFLKQKTSPVLIISYEMLIRCMERLQGASFDLLLCDEGHRLKNAQIKTSSLLSRLDIHRRIILTGTPIQNDLQELYSLIEFVNPGILGSSAMFKKVYEHPIIQSQQPTASKEDKDIGEIRAAELNRLTSQFTLRRTQDIINKYLPPKAEFVVFCQPSKMQIDLYEAIVGSRGLQRCLINREVGDHLAAICILRKLCNHPSLLFADESKEQNSEIQNEISSLIPQELSRNVYSEENSGKLAVISCFLCSMAETLSEKIVIVSNFTTTLDMLQHLCEHYKYPLLRLDGSTPTSKRQALVDRFNSSHCQEFVFLLSAKAGGVGLNLIGASRIILFDVDWNPATDLQAMARVWRDGQMKKVHIYRLILAGSIEEKIYQRQICKQGISGCVVDARNSSKVHFSTEELKDLFCFHPDTSSLTHDLLECPCDQMGGEGKTCFPEPLLDDRECRLVKDAPRQTSTTMDQLFSWQHFALPEGSAMLEGCLELLLWLQPLVVPSDPPIPASYTFPQEDARLLRPITRVREGPSLSPCFGELRVYMHPPKDYRPIWLDDTSPKGVRFNDPFSREVFSDGRKPRKSWTSHSYLRVREKNLVRQRQPFSTAFGSRIG